MGDQTTTAIGTLASDAALHEALRRLAEGGEGALSLPFLSPAEIAPLLTEARSLPFRRARPQVGEGERSVHQDFDLATEVPPGGAIGAFADRLEGRLKRLGAGWIEPGFTLNDRIAQRYGPGCAGISPHRDHLRYRNLVALLTLVGEARLWLCADRSGQDPRELAIAPGHLVLMRAPGFAGGEERPFHYLGEVLSERISLGLRHDARAA